MKPTYLFPLILLACVPSLFAKQIQTETALSDLGVLRPDRLSGSQVQKDYYLPLPSRTFDAAASSVRVAVQPSPFLSPGSVVGIWINDRPVDTARVGKGGAMILEGAIPRGTKADDPSRNILKLTVKADLALTGSTTPDLSPDRAATWIDVQPDSTFSCRFDNATADWLSIGRLAITLRPQIEVVRPANASPLQTDLALKITSWIAQNSLHSELHFSDAAPDSKIPAADRFVIEPLTNGAAPIEITTEGGDRIVHIRTSSEADVAKIWNALKLAELAPLPGSHWTPSSAAASSPVKKSGALLRDLDQGSMMMSKGTGDTACSFHFELAKLTRTPADLILHLNGTTSAMTGGAEPTLAVFLNGRLIFSDLLTAGEKTFDRQVTLHAAQLHGNNEISVAMIPAAESHAVYFWQLSPESSLHVGGSAPPVEPLGLLDAALRFAEAAPYQVWMANPADWKIAAYAVAWLQRINPSHLLEPALAGSLTGKTPALVIGSLAAKPPAGLSGFPVSIKDDQLLIRSITDSSALNLAPASGLGIWQLGDLPGNIPAILVDSWGADGAATLEKVSAQMADSVWVEGGDVVIGDGLAPVLTFATREAALPALSELPAEVTKPRPIAAAPSPAAKLAGATADWMQFRWWVIGGLWLVLSAIIVWIFEQGRRRAS